MNITGSGDSLKLLTVKGSQVNDDDKVIKRKNEKCYKMGRSQ